MGRDMQIPLMLGTVNLQHTKERPLSVSMQFRISTNYPLQHSVLKAAVATVNTAWGLDTVQRTLEISEIVLFPCSSHHTQL